MLSHYACDTYPSDYKGLKSNRQTGLGWRADEPERSEGEEASAEENQGNLVYEGNIHRPSFDLYISSVLGLKLSLKLRRRDAIIRCTNLSQLWVQARLRVIISTF